MLGGGHQAMVVFIRKWFLFFALKAQKSTYPLLERWPYILWVMQMHFVRVLQCTLDSEVSVSSSSWFDHDLASNPTQAPRTKLVL